MKKLQQHDEKNIIKSCPRCLIEYNNPERLRCVYCGTLLNESLQDKDVVASARDAFENSEAASIFYFRRALKRWRGDKELLKAYLLGSYLTSRDLMFTYQYFRCRWLHGPSFERWVAMPFRWEYLLAWPWFLFALLDAFWVRLTHWSFCPVCGWKYSIFHQTDDGRHEEFHCLSCQCYDEVLQDILTGRVVTKRSLTQGDDRKNAVKDMVYRRLTRPRSFWWSLADMMAIVLGLGVSIGIIVSLVRPHLSSLVDYLKQEETILFEPVP